ncbi:RusA family crossover junction endodeoxyribonuclease [Ruminococcaceae bacterium OttesenSCG-928-A16]|nr:RusA family crossover junction endodeoxyribonuclease [Ruminococcaceae bacterium OttesenSCG-928-A16]
MIKFTIPIAPATKKNSQRIVMAGAYPKLLPSKAFVEYQTKAGWLIPCKNIGISQPVNIKATYYVKTKRKVDITNLHSALHDVLVHYGVLADDSSINPCIVASTDGSRVYVDSKNPRTEVEITTIEEI